MRVLLRGGMETWREDQCTSQLSAQPIIVTLLCPRPRTETNLHAHCQRWRARAHLMDGERAIIFIRSVTISENELVSTPGKWARPDSGPDDPSSRHRHSSKLVTDLGSARPALRRALVAGRAEEPHGPHVRTHSRPLLYTRGGSSRRVTTMWVTVRFRPFILPLICCHLFDDTPQCAPPPRDSI
jgi:hypothetical protein